MILLSIYAGTLVFGGIFVVASAIGFDKGLDSDVHADLSGADPSHVDPISGTHASTDAAAEAGAFAATFFSFRFWTFALASFGLSGTLLDLLNVDSWLSLPASLVCGFSIGYGVATVFRVVNHRNVGSIADMKTLLGREGVVLLSIDAKKPGKVRVSFDGQALDLLAHTLDTRNFERGERVLIVDMKNGEATITSTAPAASHAAH